jgi:lantibiotic leader peptide-processing serine protease
MSTSRFGSICVAIVLGGLAACDSASDPTTVPQHPQFAAAKTQPSRYLITFKSTMPSGFEARVKALGGTVSLKDDVLGFAAVIGLGEREAQSLVQDGLAQAAQIEPVIQLAPVRELKNTQPRNTINSPSNPAAAFLFSTFPIQWDMSSIHADDAWAAGKLGSTDVSVGILDTGLDYTHPDLAGHVDLARSTDLVGEADSVAKYFGLGLNPVIDLHSHGSHNGTIVSSNAIISAGVTSRTTLVGVKVCNMRGSCPTAAVLAGIRYAVDAGVQVINMSIGGSAPKNATQGFGAIVNRAFSYAKQHDVLMVIAAGNAAEDLDHNGNVFAAYCDAPHVICVSAVGPTGEAAFGPFVNVDAFSFAFSNFGRSAITVAAPGGNVVLDAHGSLVDITPVWSSCSTTGLDFGTLQPTPTDPPIGLLCPPPFLPVIGFVGTSEAAPHVTGLAASLLAEGIRGANQLRNAIIKGADDLGPTGIDPFYGRGRVNVAASLGVD